MMTNNLKYMGVKSSDKFRVGTKFYFLRSRLFLIIAVAIVVVVSIILLFVSKLFATSIVPIATTSTATVINSGQQILFDSLTNNTNTTIDYVTRQMSGYAWSTEIGWIYFGGGVENPDGPVTADIHGVLSGKARELSTGSTIDFNASPTGANVTIASSTGTFSGLAWSQDIGWIDFSGVSVPGFYLDVLAPNNPSTVTALSNPGGATLTSGNYYNHPAVSFSWTTPADNAEVTTPTGVAGYYVYFGTDNTANPYTAGGYQTGTSFTGSTSIIGNGLPYYLRMQTIDVAGNRSVSTTLFEYKYDITKPINPAYVTVSPVGWSTTDNFSFGWPNGADSGTGASNIAGYQYKRAGGGDNWSAVISGLSIDNIQSYQNGQNDFYVRSVDIAGNIADSYTGVHYYYNGSAPIAPTSLIATPPNATTNSFSFSWGEPASNGGIEGYYYSVNVKPTIDNTVYTTERTTGTMPAATQQGFNTFYVVAIDKSGQVNWDNYAEVTFECTTIAPGIPNRILISDSSDRNTNDWALTVKWQAPTLGTASKYFVYRATDGVHFSKIAAISSIAYTDTGLSSTSNYSYKITAVDNAGAESGFSSTVLKTPTGKFSESPLIVSGPDFKATATSAVVTWSTDRPSSSTVAYSKDESYSESRGQLDSVTSHKVTITGLDPGTNYNFKIQSLDENRDYTPESAFSLPYNFKTDVAPGVAEVTVSDINLTSAIISWKTTTVATSTLYYGLTNTYGQELSDNSGSGVTTHTVKLTDLSHSSTYHFKIIGTDTDGNNLVSDDYNFDTLKMPRIFNVTFEQQVNTSTSTLKVSWESNVPTTSTVLTFEGNSTSAKEASLATLSIKHSILVSGLKDNTIYSMIAQGRDAYGNLAVSDTNRITTAYDTRPPEISNIVAESTTSGYGADTVAQVIISWNTDEPGTSQVEYAEGITGESYTMSTAKDSALSDSHVVILRDLKPSSSYYYRVVSADASGNTAKSEAGSALTGFIQSSVLDTVLKSLQGVFGWLFK